MTTDVESASPATIAGSASIRPRSGRLALRRALLLIGALLMVLILASHAGDAARLVAAEPLAPASAMPPAATSRGGTTRGGPVVLDTTPSHEWQALQAGGLSTLERDRRAILAMAGTYRVAFEFMEVARFEPGERGVPYQSWGTEKVYVDRDSGRSISLVHIMELRVQHEDGSISPPMVMKHWRQDWDYEPKQIVEYQGRDRWRIVESSAPCHLARVPVGMFGDALAIQLDACALFNRYDLLQSRLADAPGEPIRHMRGDDVPVDTKICKPQAFALM